MSDLLKRLRAKSADYRAAKSPAWGDLMAEAADRIAALEAALREIVALYDDEDWPDDSGAMLQPLEIARAALAAAETEVKP